jgi:AAA domain
MIRVSGTTEGPEADAARELCRIVLASWPWVEHDPQTVIELVAGVQCHGQSTRDLDVVLLASFSDRARYAPFLSFQRRGDRQWLRPPEVQVVSLCIVVEVKDNDPADVRFEGPRLQVRYRHGTEEHWHGASEQSFKQVFAFRNYLASQGIESPFVCNVIWLRQIPSIHLPPRPHNLLGANLTWDMLINVVAQLNPPREHEGEWILGVWRDEQGNNLTPVVRLLTQQLIPTRLDGVRMARIARAALLADWLGDVGTKQVTLRGRGGTGKTILLLQLAWKLYQEQSSRVLLLTYNKALMADLRRLLTLIGADDPSDGRSIQIQTVHAFLGSVFRGLGLLKPDEDLLERYGALKQEVLDLVRAGGITPADIERLMTERTEAFGWDYVFIDEAQDWPEDERDLLRAIYSPQRFVIADGVDQFVRSQQACDWKAGLSRSETKIVPLSRCLRMKASLAKFTNYFAEELGLAGWSVEAHEEAPGGRVIVVEGDYFSSRVVHDRLLLANAADGNQPVDALVCVPPSQVLRDETVRSVAAEKLRSWGHEVWDGVSTEVRDSYPLSVSQMRVVQYDSCRGLEGWFVVNLGLDDFFRYKEQSWRPPAESAAGAFPDDPLAADRFACRWLMIPLCRAVDTLVVQIGRESSRVHAALERVAARCPDFVEWHSVSMA